MSTIRDVSLAHMPYLILDIFYWCARGRIISMHSTGVPDISISSKIIIIRIAFTNNFIRIVSRSNFVRMSNGRCFARGNVANWNHFNFFPLCQLDANLSCFFLCLFLFTVLCTIEFWYSAAWVQWTLENCFVKIYACVYIIIIPSHMQ